VILVTVFCLVSNENNVLNFEVEVDCLVWLVGIDEGLAKG
jgi:hypothetical protein